MCIAIIQPPKALLTKRLMSNYWCQNDDGGGYAFSGEGIPLTIEKGFWTFKTFWRSYRQNLARYPLATFLIHFRLATSGVDGLKNCHPFLINPDMAFAHNGILSEWSNENKKKSDTHRFAVEVLQVLPKGFIDNPGATFLLEQYAGESRSKFIFLLSGGKYRIFGEKQGTWKGGSWFSTPMWGYQTGSDNWWKNRLDYGDEDYGEGYNFGTNGHGYRMVDRRTSAQTTASEASGYAYCKDCHVKEEKGQLIDVTPKGQGEPYLICEDCYQEMCVELVEDGKDEKTTQEIMDRKITATERRRTWAGLKPMETGKSLLLPHAKTDVDADGAVRMWLDQKKKEQDEAGDKAAKILGGSITAGGFVHKIVSVESKGPVPVKVLQ